MFLLFVGGCLVLLSLSPSPAQHVVRMAWGVVLVLVGGWVLLSGNAVALVRGALARSTLGDLAGARAMLDAAERRYPWLVGANVELQRALMASREGDPAAVETHAGRVLARRRTGFLADAARGLRALSRAERRDVSGARNDIALLRASALPHAGPRAHAELAEALVLELEGRTRALRDHLVRHGFLLHGYLPPSERTRLRDVRGAAYRAPDLPADAPTAGDSAPLGLPAPRPRAVRAVYLVLGFATLLAVALVLRHRLPTPGPEIAVYLVGGAALIGLIAGSIASARRQDTRLEAARVLVALGDLDAAKRELCGALRTKNRVLGAMAELELAKVADRQADFEASLALCEHALLALSSRKRVVAVDLLAAELYAVKAHALVVMGRPDEAQRLLDAAGRLKHRSPGLADTLLRAAIIGHARKGDWASVRALAVSGDIADPRTELIGQAAAAIDGGDALHIASLRAWLDDWPLGATWIARAVPALGEMLRPEGQSS
jgi:tetratricopeptide (TPR) repeat protein